MSLDLYGSPAPNSGISDSNKFVSLFKLCNKIKDQTSTRKEVLIVRNCFIKFLNFFVKSKLDVIPFTFKFDTRFLSDILR